MQRMSLLAALALLMVLSPTYAAAQATTARLVGTVKEPTGAVIPGASVVATNLDTGTRRDAITNDEGDFVIPNVPIGRYEVAAELAGFKRVVRSPVPLDVDQTARVDFELEVGNLTETVEVKASIPLVNSETSSIGQVIGETQVRNLPLNGRNFIQLGLLVPAPRRARRAPARCPPGRAASPSPPTASVPIRTTGCSTAWTTTRCSSAWR